MTARDELQQIIRFDSSIAIADRLGKVAWDKIGSSALKWGGTGAIGGAVAGGVSGGMDNGDVLGGALHGATSGAILGAAGGAMNKAGAFNHIIGTPEQRAARAAARATAAPRAAAGAAAQPAAPATAQASYRAAAQARMSNVDELGGSFAGNPAIPNASVADAIAANQARTARAKGIAEMYGAKGRGASSSGASATGSYGRTASDPGALGDRAPRPQSTQAAANPAAPGKRYSSVDEAVRNPVNTEAWSKLDPSVQRRARGVAEHYNTGGDPTAGGRYQAMRERHGFSARDELSRIINFEATDEIRLGEANRVAAFLKQRYNPIATNRYREGMRQHAMLGNAEGFELFRDAAKLPATGRHSNIHTERDWIANDARTIRNKDRGARYTTGPRTPGGSGAAILRKNELSAREELEVIRFGSISRARLWRLPPESNAASILERKVDAKKAFRTLGGLKDTKDKFWVNPRSNPRGISAYDSPSQRIRIEMPLERQAALRKRLGDHSLFLRKKQATKIKEPTDDSYWSARDQLNTILLGVDPRPRNSLGMFGGDEPMGPNPKDMSLTYGRAAGLGATAGAAGVGAGMGMKALIERLKAMKKK